MKIIILGAGQVGSSLLASLAGEKNDIVMIDLRSDLLEKLQGRFDISTIQGNAAHPPVLAQAGAAEADMLIAATSDDETNMLACQIYDLQRHVCSSRNRELDRCPWVKRIRIVR